VTEVDELEVLIRSTATGTGFATAGAQAKAMNVEMAALGGGMATHGGTVVAAEKDITREADSMARALGSAGESGAKAISRFEALGGTLASSGALGIGIGAALVGTTMLIEGSKKAIENSDRQEQSTRSLTQAYDTMGQSLQVQGAWIGAFLNTNRRFIDDQYAARDAIATLVRAGYDQVEVQRIANDAVDLAAVKGVSYADAVTTLNLALQGNTRGLRDLGLSAQQVSAIMHQATADNKELAAANKTLESDTNALAKAQDALNLQNDRLHAKNTVTQADLDVLHLKQKAVSDLTAKVTADQNALADAQGNIATTASMQSTLLDTVEPKIAKARDTTTDLKQAQDDLNKSWQDASQVYGPGLTRALANAIDIVNLSGQAGALAVAHPDRVFRAVTGAPAPKPVVPRTEQNLLGNPQGDPTYIMETTTASQRLSEWQDRLFTSTTATTQAEQRQAEMADDLTINLGKQRDESDNLTTRNGALQNALYNTEVAQNSISTRITEVLGKYRDEADTADTTAARNRDAWGLTAQYVSQLAAHIRSEKFDAVVNVDYGSVEAAREAFDGLVQHVRSEISQRWDLNIGVQNSGTSGFFNP